MLAATAATCGKLAREVVELSRPEIGEVREEGGHLRGASSTMPQKANPIASEAVVGLSILSAQHARRPARRAAGDARARRRGVAGGVGRAAAHVRRDRRRTGRVRERLLEGSAVFPERMRANLDAEGGSDHGRGGDDRRRRRRRAGRRSCAGCRGLSRCAREGISLQEALERTLGPRVARRAAAPRRRARSGRLPRRDRRDRRPLRSRGGRAAAQEAAAAGGWKSSIVIPSGSLR